MLESISCQYEDVRALLLERGEEGRLNDLSEETLNAMVMFLQRFKEATKALEASKTPILHLTAVWLDRLKCHLQPSSTDNLTFSSLKAKCLRILVEKYKIHLLHKLAMFLNPKLKSLKLLAEEHAMETVHNEVRRLVKDIKERCASPTQRVASSPPPGKELDNRRDYPTSRIPLPAMSALRMKWAHTSTSSHRGRRISMFSAGGRSMQPGFRMWHTLLVRFFPFELQAPRKH
ncbi:Zinc finger protein 618 [Dissostichus eleginoides]|uniref:Zinc finger protein 618 n=1 Tax=Dissostichus eleginoides TaxID=100907 RepID=A0AAD9F069_DISEL|nr:Zinc finger protein 618 [Dissostichus eleginoides]